MSSNRQPNYHKRLKVTVIGIVILGTVGILSVTVFAPQVAYVFSLISKHRFDTGDQTILKPRAPIFNNLKEETNQTNITIEGYAEPGATVKLFINGPEKQSVIVDSEGIFTFTNVELISGRNTIFAKLTNSEGYESDPSRTYNVVVDSKNPEVEIESPKNESVIKNLDRRIKIIGKINEKANIKINDSMVIQKPDLSFEHSLGAKEGWNTIKITVEDKAGNIQEEELKIRYEHTGD